jgi:hypothetical protein
VVSVLAIGHRRTLVTGSTARSDNRTLEVSRFGQVGV